MLVERKFVEVSKPHKIASQIFGAILVGACYP